MRAAADVATTRYSDLSSSTVEVIEESKRKINSDYMFTLFDKNQDGVISVDEFKEVIGELGADGEDAHELMKLVDSNFDGSVSVEEFQDFRRQVCHLFFVASVLSWSFSIFFEIIKGLVHVKYVNTLELNVKLRGKSRRIWGAYS